MKVLILGLLLGMALRGLLPVPVFTENHNALTQASQEAEHPPCVPPEKRPAKQPDAISRQNVEALTQMTTATVVEPRSVTWNEDGDALYIASANGLDILEIGSSGPRHLLAIPAGEILLDVSVSGAIATMSDPQTIVLRDGHSGDEIAVIETEFPLSSARFTPDGLQLFVVMDEGSLLRTWDAGAGVKIQEFRHPDAMSKPYSIEFDPTGGSLVWLSPTGGRTLHLESGVFGPPIRFGDTLVDAAVSPSGALLVATSDDAISLWDTDMATLSESKPGTRAFSLSYACDGELLAMASEGGVTILDAVSATDRHAIPGEAFDAQFSPDGRALAIAGANGEVSIWTPQ